MHDDRYSSTEFAIKGSVTKKTLRHYAKIGLLGPSAIDENGYWYYDETALEKLTLISSLKCTGLSLSEIKNTIDSDFKTLLPIIDEKMRYIDEQINALETAKRLLNRLQNKNALRVDTAIKESIEEDHLDWLRNTLSSEQLAIVEKMATDENAYEEHLRIMALIKDFKVHLGSKNEERIQEMIHLIKEIYRQSALDDDTIKKMMTFLINSSISGPSHSKIINQEEAHELLRRL